MRTKRELIGICSLFVASLCVAQGSKEKNKQVETTKPDLSGTWALDPTKSNLGRDISNYVLTIAHHEPEIRITKAYKRGKRDVKEEVIYHTDGRPEFDPHQTPDDPLPETRWQGNKLVRKLVTGPRGFQFVTIQQMVDGLHENL